MLFVLLENKTETRETEEEKKEMLKSCKYCGKIHDSKIRCDAMPKPYGAKTGNDIEKFRSGSKWRRLSERIRQRDKYLCKACLIGIDAPSKLNPIGLSVHHIVPMREDKTKWTDENNLITLCGYHHEKAEGGTLSRKELKELVNKPIDGMGMAAENSPPEC